MDLKKSGSRDFPADFVWGAATCPACCEGETVSDWGRLSAPDGSVPDDGPRHWRRYRYDFRAMADLGLTAYRFGCDWGRLQRAPYAELNRIDGYRYLEMLAELRSLGIEPWVTLFHNALPRWADAAGGWLNPETPRWFEDFARRLANLTDGEVVNWITVHEPHVYAMSRFAWGAYPGGAWGRLDQVRTALARMRHGHQLAAGALRRRLHQAKIGLSLPGAAFSPKRPWHPGDWLAAGVSDWALNRYGLKRFLSGDGACDFLMLGAGNEVRVRAWDSLSLSSGVAASLATRMRHSGGDTTAHRRRQRLGAWIRRCRLPVYLVGSIGSTDASVLNSVLSAYAGNGSAPAASGFFYDPLLDQFDLETGLASGSGLLRVDFHDADRRRELRPHARKFGHIVKSGCLRAR